MPANTTDLEKRLWEAADQLRANSKLKSSEYSTPVLGLLFLRYADWKFSKAEAKLKDKGSSRREISKADYQARSVMYLPEEARFSTLLNLPEGANIGRKINEAMSAIERENTQLGVKVAKTLLAKYFFTKKSVSVEP